MQIGHLVILVVEVVVIVLLVLVAVVECLNKNVDVIVNLQDANSAKSSTVLYALYTLNILLHTI